jgi:hypothetical protein
MKTAIKIAAVLALAAALAYYGWLAAPWLRLR